MTRLTNSFDPRKMVGKMSIPEQAKILDIKILERDSESWDMFDYPGWYVYATGRLDYPVGFAHERDGMDYGQVRTLNDAMASIKAASTQKRVHVVAWRFNYGGGFFWYPTAEQANSAFEEEFENVDKSRDDWTAYRFTFDVPTDTPKDNITKTIDDQLDELCANAEYVYGTNPWYASRRKYEVAAIPWTPKHDQRAPWTEGNAPLAQELGETLGCVMELTPINAGAEGSDYPVGFVNHDPDLPDYIVQNHINLWANAPKLLEALDRTQAALAAWRDDQPIRDEEGSSISLEEFKYIFVDPVMALFQDPEKD